MAPGLVAQQGAVFAPGHQQVGGQEVQGLHARRQQSRPEVPHQLRRLLRGGPALGDGPGGVERRVR